MNCIPPKHEYELLHGHSVNLFYVILLLIAARMIPSSGPGPGPFSSIEILMVLSASAGMILQDIGWMPCRFTTMRGDEWLRMRIS